MDRQDVEDVMGRARQFEEELSSIGVSVKVDVRGLEPILMSTGLMGLQPVRRLRKGF